MKQKTFIIALLAIVIFSFVLSEQVSAATTKTSWKDYFSWNETKMIKKIASDYVRDRLENSNGDWKKLVTGKNLDDNSITESKIKDGVITTGKLGNGAVTLSKLSSNNCASGQIIKYNGSAWVCGADNGGSGGDSVWGEASGNIYYNSGNVGIGTTNPLQKLVVNQTNAADIANFYGVDNGTGWTGINIFGVGNGVKPYLSFQNTEDAYFGDIEPIDVGGGVHSGLLLYGSDGPVGINNDAGWGVYEDTTGNVGIGTTSPEAKLSVVGGVLISDNLKLIASSPTLIGSITDSTAFPYPYGLAFRDNIAYVLSDNGESGSVDLAVVDITNPASPEIISTFKDPTNLDGHAGAVAISGTHAFISNYTDRIATVDISNPHSLSTVGAVVDASNLKGINTMKVSGNYLYVGMCSGASDPSISIVDISNPSSPRVRGHISNPNLPCSYIIDVQGRYLYAPQDDNTTGKSNFTIVDISNPDNPTIVGTLDDDTNLSYAAGISVVGKVAYVYASDARDGMGSSVNAIDVSNPASPRLISSLHSNTFVEDNNIAIAYPYLYAEGNASSPGIMVVDISDPTNMSIVHTISAPTAVGYPVAIYSKYLFSGSGNPGSIGFSVFDISGIESQSAGIGSLLAGKIDTQGDLSVGHDLSVGNGITAGIQGISTEGNVAGKDFFATGNVGIGTTSPDEKLTVNGNSLTYGHIGVGLSAVLDGMDDHLLYDAQTATSTVATYKETSTDTNGLNGGYYGITINPSGNVDNSSTALASDLQLTGSHDFNHVYIGAYNQVHNEGSGIVADMTGTYGGGYNASSGTINTLSGFKTYSGNYGSGHIGTIYNYDSMAEIDDGSIDTLSLFYGRTPFKGGGTITNLYGLYLEDMAGATNNYAIYSAGGKSYFSDNIGIGTTAPTEKLDVNSDTIRIRTEKTPANASATCDKGEIVWDASYVYVCVATNTWKRSPLTSW